MLFNKTIADYYSVRINKTTSLTYKHTSTLVTQHLIKVAIA